MEGLSRIDKLGNDLWNLRKWVQFVIIFDKLLVSQIWLSIDCLISDQWSQSLPLLQRLVIYINRFLTGQRSITQISQMLIIFKYSIIILLNETVITQMKTWAHKCYSITTDMDSIFRYQSTLKIFCSLIEYHNERLKYYEWNTNDIIMLLWQLMAQNFSISIILNILQYNPGNANRGWWGILKYPPQRKNFENTPLKILGKIFEKLGKTQKFRSI